MPIAQPILGDEENNAVPAVLPRGPDTAVFKEEFADCRGVPHAVAVTNGTAVHYRGVTDEARAYVCETINGVI